MINILGFSFLDNQSRFYLCIILLLPELIPDLYEEEMDAYSVSTGSSKTKPWMPGVPLCPHEAGLRCDVPRTKGFITDRPCLTYLEPCVVRVVVNKVYDYRRIIKIQNLA